MWDLPGPGLEPVSPTLAGGFLTTVPPGKPRPFLCVRYNDIRKYILYFVFYAIFLNFIFLIQQVFISYLFYTY